MKPKAFDKSTCAMSAINNNHSHRTDSDYYFSEKMNKNEQVTANIPLETVRTSESKHLKRKNSSGETQVRYIQCILPFLCILQVISVVSVSVCFYMYKVTLDDYDKLHNEVRLLRSEYEKDFQTLRHEIEVNITGQVRDVQQLSKNLLEAQSKLHDYDAASFDYETDGDEEENETDFSPHPPLPISEEPDNQRPSTRFRDSLSEELRKKIQQSLREDPDKEFSLQILTPKAKSPPRELGSEDREGSREIHQLKNLHSDELQQSFTENSAEEGNSTQTVTSTTVQPEELDSKVKAVQDDRRYSRSIHNQRDPYEGINPDKNDAEGDYKDIESPENTKLNHRLQKSEDEETSTISKKSTRISMMPRSQKHYSSTTMASPESNSTQNYSQKGSAQSSKNIQDAMLSLQLSLERFQKDQRNGRAENVQSSLSETIAIHLIGDTSTHRSKKYYDANNRMYHPTGHIKDWIVDKRITTFEDTENQSFRLDNGHLKIKQAGLYFLYAQIYYSTEQDTSGFNILVNNNVVMRCTTTGMSFVQMTDPKSPAPNSCYTAGLVRISENDKLIIRETEGNRFTIFEPTRSFFGLFKIG